MKSKFAITCLSMAALLTPMLTFAGDDADVDRHNAKAFVKDSEITTKIKTKLASEHITSLAHIHVDTDAGGVVWLTGTAKSQDEISRVVEIARGTEHVVSIKNNLKVQK